MKSIKSRIQPIINYHLKCDSESLIVVCLFPVGFFLAVLLCLVVFRVQLYSSGNEINEKESELHGNKNTNDIYAAIHLFFPSF